MKYAATYLAAVVVLALPSFAFAQAQRLSGTIVSVDGPTIMLKTTKGEDVKVTLAEKGTVLAVEKVTMEGIKQGEFVGVGAMPQADGSQRAIAIHIFQPKQRGTGEGHRPWDLQPGSTMTNAAIATTVGSTEGQVLTVRYKEGEQRVLVTDKTVIVRYVPGERDDLKPGVAVFLNNAKALPDGTIEAPTVSYGRDGVVPPM